MGNENKNAISPVEPGKPTIPVEKSKQGSSEPIHFTPRKEESARQTADNLQRQSQNLQKREAQKLAERNARAEELRIEQEKQEARKKEKARLAKMSKEERKALEAEQKEKARKIQERDRERKKEQALKKDEASTPPLQSKSDKPVTSVPKKNDRATTVIDGHPVAPVRGGMYALGPRASEQRVIESQRTQPKALIDKITEKRKQKPLPKPVKQQEFTSKDDNTLHEKKQSEKEKEFLKPVTDNLIFSISPSIDTREEINSPRNQARMELLKRYALQTLNQFETMGDLLEIAFLLDESGLLAEIDSQLEESVRMLRTKCNGNISLLNFRLGKDKPTDKMPVDSKDLQTASEVSKLISNLMNGTLAGFPQAKKLYLENPLLHPDVYHRSVMTRKSIPFLEAIAFFDVHLTHQIIKGEKAKEYAQKVVDSENFAIVEQLRVTIDSLGFGVTDRPWINILPPEIGKNIYTQAEQKGKFKLWLLQHPPAYLENLLASKYQPVYDAFGIKYEPKRRQLDLSLLSIPWQTVDQTIKQNFNLESIFHEATENEAIASAHLFPLEFFLQSACSKIQRGNHPLSDTILWLQTQNGIAETIAFLTESEDKRNFPRPLVPEENNFAEIPSRQQLVKFADILNALSSLYQAIGQPFSSEKTNLIIALSQIVNSHFDDDDHPDNLKTAAEIFIEACGRDGFFKREKLADGEIELTANAPEFISYEAIAILCGATNQETIQQFVDAIHHFFYRAETNQLPRYLEKSDFEKALVFWETRGQISPDIPATANLTTGLNEVRTNSNTLAVTPGGNLTIKEQVIIEHPNRQWHPWKFFLDAQLTKPTTINAALSEWAGKTYQQDLNLWTMVNPLRAKMLTFWKEKMKPEYENINHQIRRREEQIDQTANELNLTSDQILELKRKIETDKIGYKDDDVVDELRKMYQIAVIDPTPLWSLPPKIYDLLAHIQQWRHAIHQKHELDEKLDSICKNGAQRNLVQTKVGTEIPIPPAIETIKQIIRPTLSAITIQVIGLVDAGDADVTAQLSDDEIIRFSMIQSESGQPIATAKSRAVVKLIQHLQDLDMIAFPENVLLDDNDVWKKIHQVLEEVGQTLHEFEDRFISQENTPSTVVLGKPQLPNPSSDTREERSKATMPFFNVQGFSEHAPEYNDAFITSLQSLSLDELYEVEKAYQKIKRGSGQSFFAHMLNKRKILSLIHQEIQKR